MYTYLKNKNILVTGGTGFVGSHLIEELVKQKVNVVTTFLTLKPNSYFNSLMLAQKVNMFHADVTDFEKLYNIVTKFDVQYIFHLAAQPIVDIAYHNPKHTINTNVIGTVNILECARLYPRIKGVIVASSDKAYGKLESGKYIETDPLRGDHPYEVSKSAADLICNAYFKTYGVPVATTRFGNIYGEGDLNYSRIIPGIMKSLVMKETLQIRSNGKFIRDLLYVKDVVEGYLTVMEHIDRTKGNAYNFGSKDTLSVLEVIKTAQKVLKKKLHYEILDIARNEIPYQSLNYDKIKAELKWRPKYSLKTTLPRIYRWYKKSFLYEKD